MLEDREREVTDRLRTLRQSLPDEWAEVREGGDEAPQRLAEDLDFAIVEKASETATRIHDALDRMDHGLDRTCGECGRPIERRRLQALPFADTCIVCQRRREASCSVATPIARL
jgi:RNA polymerase-binding transcription factor DksA